MTIPLLKLRPATQLELALAEEERRRAARKRAEAECDALDELLSAAVSRIGHKELADQLGMGEETSLLYHMLARRNGRRPPAELLLRCLALDTSDELITGIAELTGYEVPKRRVLLEPEEALRQLCSEAVRRFGQGGEQLVRDVLGQRPETP